MVNCHLRDCGKENAPFCSFYFLQFYRSHHRLRVRLGDGAVVGDGSETGSTRGGNDSPGTSRPSRRMGGGLRSVTVLPWLELGGREADHIAARAEADLILAADLDIGVGEKGRVQIQRERRHALHAAVRPVVVDLVEVVGVALFFPVGLADYFDFHHFSVSFTILDTGAPFK